MLFSRPRDIVDDIAICLAFYTRLPVPVSGGRSFAEAQWAAPVAGCGGRVDRRACIFSPPTLIGLPATVAAALSVASRPFLSPARCTRTAFPICADGFGGGKTREQQARDHARQPHRHLWRRARSCSPLLLRWSALAAFATPDARPLCSDRGARRRTRHDAGIFMRLVPPARSDGLSAGAGTRPGFRRASSPALIAAAACCLLALGFGSAAVCACSAARPAVSRSCAVLCERQIGGQTGDVLGALEQLSEIAVLLIACATLLPDQTEFRMTRFAAMEDLRAACLTLPEGDDAAVAEAPARQDSLTKPQGSLGRLEEIVAWLARWQGRATTEARQCRGHRLCRFAWRHRAGRVGLPGRGHRPDGGEFRRPAAPRSTNSPAPPAPVSTSIPLEVERPTGDFTQQAAMSEAEFLAAVSTGYDAVARRTPTWSAFGEMGIGNTTTAGSRLPPHFTARRAQRWVGRGTGVDDAGLARKAAAVDAGA